ncbi:MAG: Yip1 family protein [Terricaulis silvestris]
MSANPDENPAEKPRLKFDAAQAREHATAARAKAEFILSRVYGLVRDPKTEWGQIRDEETNIASIIFGYVAPIAAIPPLCDLIGRFVFPTVIAGIVVRPRLDEALISVLMTWVVSIALVYLLGLLINALAEQFDAERNDLLAQKVAAYAMTPIFFSGFFSLWPPIWWFSLFAIGYGVYLFYAGLQALMKTPQDRAIPYATSVVVAGLVAFVVLFSISSCVAGMGHV